MNYILKYLPLVFLLLLQLFFLINLQFTAWPEMLSYPYLRNNNFLLYKDMIHPYPPVLTMVLSYIYSIFGYGLEVLQTISWTVIISSSVLIYLLVQYLAKKENLALLATGIYVLLQPFLEGNMLWFDIVIIPPALLGLFFLLRYQDKKRAKWIIFAGFSFAIAALTKQTAAIFLIASATFLFLKNRSLKELWLLSIGSIALVVPLLARLAQEGALSGFLNWTLLYPVGEWGKFPGYVQMLPNIREWVVLGILFLPLIMLIIVRRKIKFDSRLALLLLFLAGAAVAIYPRFSFFHFQPALAFLVISLVFLIKEWRIKNALLASVLFLLILFPFVYRPAFSLDWQKEARFYGPEDKQLALKIREATLLDDEVFLQGLHSGLYVLAGRIPGKPWVDNFGWYLEIPGVQEEILDNWEANPPEYIFWRKPLPGNWFDLGTYQPERIVSHTEEKYNRIGELSKDIEIWRQND